MNTQEFEYSFYSKRISELEEQCSKDEVIDAQIMLQIIKSNANYYPKQHQAMLELDAYNRLKNILAKNNVEELSDLVEPELKNNITFDEKEIMLNGYIKQIYLEKANYSNSINKEMLSEIKQFVNWASIGKSKNIFLLRDMLLAYFYANTKFTDNQPLLFGRKMLNYFFTNISNNEFDFGSDDDDIYFQFLAIIFEGAIKYNDDFDKFFAYIKPKFLKIIKSCSPLYTYLTQYLNKISGKQIMVIESGRYGTMPLILKCLDDRIDFRLFTTSPEFYKLYKGRFYTKNISEMILLEYSYSQNYLFVFSSIKNGEIMIKRIKDKQIIDQSLTEIYEITK